jgi:hypothetical protein
MAEFVQKLSNNAIWTIAPTLDYATVYLYTNADVERYINTSIVNDWQDKYFDFLKTFDALNIYRKEQFILLLDSKENFDTIYGGSWYHFYK